MAETTTITVRIGTETKAKLDRLAEITQRSRSWLAAEALEGFVRDELAICEGILEGIADIEAGRTIPHEEVMRRSREVIESAKARQAAAE